MGFPLIVSTTLADFFMFMFLFREIFFRITYEKMTKFMIDWLTVNRTMTR